MDSLPTVSMHSWLIVMAIGLSPATALSALDAIGRVHQRKALARPTAGEEKERLGGGQ
jgi:hypothetical protein